MIQIRKIGKAPHKPVHTLLLVMALVHFIVFLLG